MNLVRQNTPWESYCIDGTPIYVKREDLSCPYPGPGFSKIRGIEKVIHSLMRNMIPPTAIGVLDTIHSKAGWGVSYICQQLNIPCLVFYPLRKSDDKDNLRIFQRMAQQFGAEVIPMKATKSSVLYYQSRKIFLDKHPNGFMMPNGLQLYDTIVQTSFEVSTAPHELLSGTWVVSVSSGTIGCGVAMGLDRMNFSGSLVFHFGFSRSMAEMNKKVKSYSKVPVVMVDEGYAYADAVQYSSPFPCNPWYDRKAWKWVCENIHQLKGPIVFWNIGE